MIHSFSKIKTDGNFNEDFKTHETLGLLQYLPANLFWNILRESIVYNDNVPCSAGEILKVDFWVKWYNVKKTNAERRYIEPDVFIRFENFDCIIEVKKTEVVGQHRDQWYDQILAYRDEYPENNKLIYIALGGNRDFNKNHKDDYSEVYKASWRRLLRALHRVLDERRLLTYSTFSINQEIRILQSVIETFHRYNEYECEFLDSINFDEIKMSNEELNKLWIMK